MENPRIVFPAAGQVELEDAPMSALRPGEVRIRTACTMISVGTELSVLAGDFPPDSQWAANFSFPHHPGYNNIGAVIELGPDVASEWLGRKVGTWGEHARYVVQQAAKLYPACEELADEQAVFFTIPQIVMNAVRRSRLTWGESVVVYGAGLLGQFAARLARLCGATQVCVVDVSDFRLQRLPDDAGVTAIHAERDRPADVVRRLTAGRMADVVFEVTGAADLIPREFEVLREQGRMVMLSSPRGRTAFDFHDLCNRFSYTIIGAHNFSHPPTATLDNPWTMARHVELFFNYLRSGEIDVTPLISHRASFEQAPAMYRQMLADRSQTLGVVIHWN